MRRKNCVWCARSASPPPRPPGPLPDSAVQDRAAPKPHFCIFCNGIEPEGNLNLNRRRFALTWRMCGACRWDGVMCTVPGPQAIAESPRPPPPPGLPARPQEGFGGQCSPQGPVSSEVAKLQRVHEGAPLPQVLLGRLPG